MKTLQHFTLCLHLTCNLRRSFITLESQKYFGILLPLLLFLLAPNNLLANTYFSSTNTDHFNVSLANGTDGYNFINFRTITYDFYGEEDRMDNFTVYYSINNGVTYTQILKFTIGDNNAFATWTPTNSAAAGYFSATAGESNTSSSDLRYANYRWKYPQSLTGQTIRFKISYGWDLNWYHDSTIETIGSSDLFYVTTPSYSPSITSSAFSPKPGNNVEFTYTKSATSSPVNKVYIYSDATYSTLLSSFSVDVASVTGTNTFAWTNSFAAASNLYVKYVYEINDAFNALSPPKSYPSNKYTSNKGYILPKSLNTVYDNCAKAVTLSWSVDNFATLLNTGLWVVERKLSSETNYTELTSTLASSTVSYYDNTILYDKVYNYRLRFVPTGMDKTRIITEFSKTGTIDSKRTVLNTMLFATFTKTVAENPKIKLSWNPNWCFKPEITIQRKNTATQAVTDIKVTSTGNTNTNFIFDENLTENLLYLYRFMITNEDLLTYTAWQEVTIKDEVKYKSVTSSKGTLADRIQLKWNVEREDLCNSFFIKRQIYEEGVNNTQVDIANISKNGQYYSYDDREISPGILYKYTLGSQFKLPSSVIDTVYYKSEIIGYAQASGTVSGRVTFGSGTAVDSVSVFASNANESESLYKAIHFNGATGGLGQVSLTPTQHGCVKTGFSWQAWLLPQDYVKEMAIYECLKEYSIWFEKGKLSVNLDQINSISPLISYDMNDISKYPKGQYFHASVTFDGYNKLLLYINGKEVVSKTLVGNEILNTDKCQNLKMRTDTTIAYIGDGFLVKGAYKGYIDDLRLWSSPLTSAEINSNYNRYINGNETGIIGYWQFDEGLNGYAFDKSNYKKTYNEHHIRFTSAESSTTVPTLDQLSIKGVTDKNGNYLIAGLPFIGDGSTYTFTASKQSHEFEPSELSRHLTFQSSVHNSVDFKDISSFQVRIQVLYDNTNFTVDSVDILVDGSVLFTNQKIVNTGSIGECIIDVPIGIHTITVSKRGHTFVDGTKKSTAVTMNFTQPILGNPIVFYDQTKVILAGRLVGGVTQAEKPLGFGLSNANIGEAVITLEAQGGDYQLNLTNNTISIAGAITDTINSTATVAAGKKEISITTDINTGEFRILVPPLKYKVTNVTTRGGLNKTNFALTEFQPDPNILLKDTTTINNKLMSFKYHNRLDFTYRVDNISIKVFDPLMPTNVFGDSIFLYNNLVNNTIVKIPLYNCLNNNTSTPAYNVGGNPVYQYSYPIYQTAKIYKLRVLAYEQYSHPDNWVKMAAFCKVPASNAKITIQNDLGRYELPLGSDGATADNTLAKEFLFNEEGVFDYSFKAGFPNLVSPYTLGLKIMVDYKDKQSAWDQNTTFKAIVLGDILTGTDFVTAGPDLISFVLRDPPGSNSYSYMKKGTTVSNSYSFNRSYIGSESLKGTINYGQKVEIAYGLGVAKIDEVKIDNKTGAGVELSQKAGSGSEINFSTTTTERIETSSSPDYVGRRGDVFVGTSTNMFFGSSRRLAAVIEGTNKVLKITEEKVGNLTAKTNFKYTYTHIVETLIPSIKDLRNNLIDSVANINTATAYEDKVRYVSSLSKTNVNFGKEGYYRFIPPTNKTQKQYENEVNKYNSSINHWVAQLAKEEDAKILAMQSKEGAIYNKINVSSDAGVTTDNSITICGSSTETDNSSFTGQAVFKTENGFSYNNLGFQFEFETKHGAESSTVTGEGNEYCTTYGYVISDENAGDYHSTDVYTPISKEYTYEDKLKSVNTIKTQFDSYSGAPLFIIRGGRTSCPYEAQEVVEFSTTNKGKPLGVATLQIEKPSIGVDDPFATEIPSGKEASYKITLSNLSESETAGWYMLTVDEKTNTKGAIITVDGQTLGNGKLYFVVPNEPMVKVLKLKQSSLDELDYKEIRLLLSSTCQSDISSAIEISAQFVPSCSDVTLDIANKIVNTNTSSILPIKITDYNRDYKNFGGIVLKIKTVNQDETEWTTIRKFINNPAILIPDQTSQNITGASITYDYPTDKIDQTYQFKAVTVCQFGTGTVENESEVITVVKDMVTPTALGAPSPSNGILTPESEVSITFNEDIQNGLINSTNLKAEGVLNGYTLKNNVGLEFAGENQAYTEQQFNLQSVPVSIEAWVKVNQVNTNGTLFAIGEGANQLKLQLNGNTLKATAGTEVFTGNIAADQNWQYLALGYNPTNKRLTVNITGQMNVNTTVINQAIASTIEPSGRLLIGNGFKGDMSQLSLWMKDRDLAAMKEDRNISKSGRELGLIGYWPLDEGVGSLAGEKVNGRNLTLKSGWYLEPKGKAIQLNGTNQNVLISTAAIPVTSDEDFSLEFWFKAGLQTNKTLFSSGKGVNDLDSINNLAVGFDAAGKLTVFAKGNTHLITTEDLQDNEWHHFAMSVLRRGNTNILVDGVSKYQIISSKFGGLDANKMSFGARYYNTDLSTSNYTTDQYFNGLLDELRIWKGALTAENIRLDMNNKLKGSESGLLAYYPFEENTLNGANQTVIDGSLKDASAVSGGVAQGTVAYTDVTPAIKEARTKENVYFNWTSTNNKIVFNILEPLSRIENCVLEFTVDRALDLNGNRMAEPVKWTVFVDNNRLKWESDGQSLKKEILAPLTFKTNIVNNSGKYENYVIDGLPSWLSVNKSAGTLNPLEKGELTFTVDNSTNVGSYESRVTLTGNNGIKEMFPVSLKVTGPRPDWSVNPYDYTSSMNVIGQVKIEGVYQEDTEDIVAAFNGTKCVGLASPQFDKNINGYYLYMDIFGDGADKLTFSLWDAATGRIYPGVDVPLIQGALVKADTFVDGAIIGSIETPQVFNATDKVEQQIGLKLGWNWISTNVTSTTPSLIDQFKSSIETAGIQLKSKIDGFISYSDAEWFGDDFALNQTSMYMLKTNQAKTLKMVGAMSKPADVNSKVTINNGWSWIGYVPSFVSPIKEALNGLATIKNGDQIKGQLGFASYSSGTWYGSLQYLTPGLGYMYYSTNSTSSSFNYPSQYLSLSKVAKQSETIESTKWTVDANKYQMSMTVTGTVLINNNEVANSNLQVAVFVGDECRGTATLKYIDSYNRYMAFLMIWGNLDDVNKKITFKSYNLSNTQELVSINQSLSYVPDNIIGSPSIPYPITFVSSGNVEVNANMLKVYPNPVSDVLHFDFNTNGIEELEVIDNIGRRLVGYTHVNKNSINVSNLVPGIYTLRIKYNGIMTNLMFVRK